ncbi:hypothetical protein CVS40_6806 [Lucilia cuprina]|nr:hypothetical protein CVS40_6806 [Lucilia cuprina]
MVQGKPKVGLCVHVIAMVQRLSVAGESVFRTLFLSESMVSCLKLTLWLAI